MSTFSFENIFFVDKIDVEWRGLWNRGAIPSSELKSDVALDITRTFIAPNSPWEISISSKQRNALDAFVRESEASALGKHVFDDCYKLVMRDLARSLQAFESTSVYQSFKSNSQCIVSLFHGVASDPRSEIHAQIRNLYKTTENVDIVATASLPDPFSHTCLTKGVVKGFVQSTSESTKFYDLNRTLLLDLPADSISLAVLIQKDDDEPLPAAPVTTVNAVGRLRRSASLLTRRKSISDGDSPAPARGFLRGGTRGQRSKSHTVGVRESTQIPETIHLKDGVEQVFGPIPTNECMLWWKYHLLKAENLVSTDGGKHYCEIGQLPAIFDQSKRVQMIDPVAAML